MRLADHPLVTAAAAHRKAAATAAAAAEKAFFEAVLVAGRQLGLTREQALAELGLGRRTGFRRLRAAGLTERG